MMSVTTVFTLVMGVSHAHAQMFIYPLKGQTPDQQEFDEFSCHKWAKEQTGFDPNQQTAATSAPKKRRGGMLGAPWAGLRLGQLEEPLLGMPAKVPPLGRQWVEGLGRLVRDGNAPEPKNNSKRLQRTSNKPIRPSTVPMGCALKEKGIRSASVT